MEKFVRIIDRITNVFGVVAGVFMILGVAMIITEIIVRSVFDSTLHITGEYMGYFMVAITFLGLALTLKDKEHIRMVFLHKLVKTGKPRFYLELYSLIVGLVIFVTMTVATTEFFWNSVVTGSQTMQLTHTYLAIPQFGLVLGSLLMSSQFMGEIIRLIIKFRNGELDEEETESQALGR